MRHFRSMLFASLLTIAISASTFASTGNISGMSAGNISGLSTGNISGLSTGNISGLDVKSTLVDYMVTLWMTVDF